MYLFDIDGTLLLSGGAGSRAINRLFKRKYGAAGAMDLVSAGGKTDSIIFQECAQLVLKRDLDSAELESIQQEYLVLLELELQKSEGFRLMPYVRECLHFLCEVAPPLGIATGNVEAAAKLKLERAQLSQHFSFGGYGSDSPIRAQLVAAAIRRGLEIGGPGLLPENFVVIGDTVRDIEAARVCGARVIAVATGSCTKEELCAEGPDAVFDTLEELPQWHSSQFVVK